MSKDASTSDDDDELRFLGFGWIKANKTKVINEYFYILEIKNNKYRRVKVKDTITLKTNQNKMEEFVIDTVSINQIKLKNSKNKSYIIKRKLNKEVKWICETAARFSNSQLTYFDRYEEIFDNPTFISIQRLFQKW